MNAGPINSPSSRKRFSAPAFWSDRPLRDMAIRTHRQMSVRQAIELMQAELGRAPSKSALARFWKSLDGPSHDITALTDVGFLDPEAARAALADRQHRRALAQMLEIEQSALASSRINHLGRAKALRRQYLRDSWAYAKTGPLPMAIVMVDVWQRITHRWRPSTLLLSALEAARQGAEQSIQALCANDREATRCVRLRLLRWLTGERETECAAPECGDGQQAPSPIVSAGGRADSRANSQRHPNRPARHPAISPQFLRDLEDQQQLSALFARDVRSDPERLLASSAQIGPDSSSSPVGAAPGNPEPIDNEPATPAAATHRLSETPE